MRRAVIGVVLAFILCATAVAEAQTAKEWVEKGYNTKDLELKIEYYTKAIELDPKYAMAYNNRGWAYYLMGEYTKALKDVTISLNLEPGRYDEAMADIDRCFKLLPGDPWWNYTRGLIYRDMGDMTKAEADLTKACNEGVDEACDALDELWRN